MVQVVDRNLLVGHPFDDVLGRLGKSREEASVVFLWSSTGNGAVGAAAVSGITANDLLKVVVETWSAASVVRRTEDVLGDRHVWLLEENDGVQTYAYVRGDVVYMATDSHADVALAFVEALP